MSRIAALLAFLALVSARPAPRGPILGIRAETASLESVYFELMGIAAASNGAAS